MNLKNTLLGQELYLNWQFWLLIWDEISYLFSFMKFIPNDSQLGLTEKSKRLNIFFLMKPMIWNLGNCLGTLNFHHLTKYYYYYESVFICYVPIRYIFTFSSFQCTLKNCAYSQILTPFSQLQVISLHLCCLSHQCK